MLIATAIYMVYGEKLIESFSATITTIFVLTIISYCCFSVAFKGHCTVFTVAALAITRKTIFSVSIICIEEFRGIWQTTFAIGTNFHAIHNHCE